MNLLKDYNSNLYIKVCSFLNFELEIINTFICNVRQKGDYSQLLMLEQLYKDIFSNPDITGCIDIQIERVLNPHYSLFRDIRPEPGNSSFFISLKIKSDSLNKIDIIYNKQLISLLRLFKNIFSVIDKPSHTIQEQDLLKYEELILDVNQKMYQFISSSNNKDLIERREKLKSNVINNLPHKGFYHMTHSDNLESILLNGIMSHKHVYANKMISVDISNKAIQNQRDRMENIFGRNIQDYVPLYINPQNPMMDSDKVQSFISNILLLEIVPHILVQEKYTLFSDGNAAEQQTNLYHNQNEMENINWQLLQEGKWMKGTESQRVMCSEVLIPNRVEVFYINRIILRDFSILEKVMRLYPNHKGIEIEINDTFFRTTRLN
jgi:hypothetical protein